MHNDTVETLIGAVVVAVAVFFLLFAYRSTGAAAVAGSLRHSRACANLVLLDLVRDLVLT